MTHTIREKQKLLARVRRIRGQVEAIASAIDPNTRPPMISATIITPQSQITAHVLRSLFSWPSPRNT